MNRLVVTVSDSSQISRLRTAIRQLKGVEQVVMLREKPSTQRTILLGKLRWELQERADSLGQLAGAKTIAAAQAKGAAVDTIRQITFPMPVNVRGQQELGLAELWPSPPRDRLSTTW